MNCRRIQNLMSAYVDSELSGVEMLAVRAHLGSCPDCGNEFESVLLVKRSLANMHPKHPSAQFAEQVCRKIDNASARAHHPRPWSLPTPASGALRLAGVAAALLGILLGVNRMGESPERYTYNPGASTIVIRSVSDQDPMNLLGMTPVTYEAPIPISPQVVERSYPWGFSGGFTQPVNLSSDFGWAVGP